MIFNFCPSWSEVGFLTSNQLGRKSIFHSRQVVGKLVFKILSNLGRIIFCIFQWNSSKNPFLVGYHWERFFLRVLPKPPIPLATTWRNISKNCRWSTHKKFGFGGYHLRRTMDKKRFLPAITWKENFHTGCECECFFWRYMKIVFPNPLINRS